MALPKCFSALVHSDPRPWPGVIPAEHQRPATIRAFAMNECRYRRCFCGVHFLVKKRSRYSFYVHDGDRHSVQSTTCARASKALLLPSQRNPGATRLCSLYEMLADKLWSWLYDVSDTLGFSFKNRGVFLAHAQSSPSICEEIMSEDLSTVRCAWLFHTQCGREGHRADGKIS